MTVEAQNVQCFPLTGTTVCGPWDGYEIQVATDGSFTNVASFDTFMRQYFDNNTAYIQDVRSRFDCPTYNGEGQQYHMTQYCALFVDTSTYRGCNAARANGPDAPPKLCERVSEAALGALRGLHANPNICSQNPSQEAAGARQDLVGLWTEYSRRRTETSANRCVNGVDYELNTCGFWTTGETTAYCAANAADPCCSGQAQTFSSITPPNTQPSGSNGGPQPTNGANGANGGNGGTGGGQLSPSATGGSSSSSSTSSAQSGSGSSSSSPQQNSALIIGGGVAAFFGLLIVAVLVMYINKRRREKGNSTGPVGSSAIAGGALANLGAGTGNSAGDAIQIAETMEVIYNYVPNLSDEIYLYVGDPVIVKTKFDDGWALGYNMTTKQEGSFPLACVAPYNPEGKVSRPANATGDLGESGRGSAVFNQRASSLYLGKTDSQYAPPPPLQQNGGGGLGGGGGYAPSEVGGYRPDSQYPESQYPESQYPESRVESQYLRPESQYPESQYRPESPFVGDAQSQYRPDSQYPMPQHQHQQYQ
ncbi:hypothetical protein HK102_007322 [Quaeritorhiza haematococci]|nr:hypothetical protein HK102_007322 [Quaeritorhiza haematococci]